MQPMPQRGVVKASGSCWELTSTGLGCDQEANAVHRHAAVLVTTAGMQTLHSQHRIH